MQTDCCLPKRVEKRRVSAVTRKACPCKHPFGQRTWPDPVSKYIGARVCNLEQVRVWTGPSVTTNCNHTQIASYKGVTCTDGMLNLHKESLIHQTFIVQIQDAIWNTDYHDSNWRDQWLTGSVKIAKLRRADRKPNAKCFQYDTSADQSLNLGLRYLMKPLRAKFLMQDWLQANFSRCDRFRLANSPLQRMLLWYSWDVFACHPGDVNVWKEQMSSFTILSACQEQRVWAPKGSSWF